jgi:hypothetical protein
MLHPFAVDRRWPKGFRVITIRATAVALALLGVAIIAVPEQVPWLTIPTSM